MVYVKVVNRAFSLTWPAAMQISCYKRKRVYIRKGINPHRNGLLLICDFPTGKKKHLLSTCRSICCNVENQQQQTPEFLPFFPDFNPILQAFSASGKLLCKSVLFFLEFKPTL